MVNDWGFLFFIVIIFSRVEDYFPQYPSYISDTFFMR